MAQESSRRRDGRYLAIALAVSALPAVGLLFVGGWTSTAPRIPEERRLHEAAVRRLGDPTAWQVTTRERHDMQSLGIPLVSQADPALGDIVVGHFGTAEMFIGKPTGSAAAEPIQVFACPVPGMPQTACLRFRP